MGDGRAGQGRAGTYEDRVHVRGGVLGGEGLVLLGDRFAQTPERCQRLENLLGQIPSHGIVPPGKRHVALPCRTHATIRTQEPRGRIDCGRE